ncbi:hypothetical protein [Streptomyces sp. NPDC002187]|uniref:hypothetical protein n=1 Tax=Streptomyces sp. NPDC002187 TaxID=3364637 RepID=UPI0036CD44A2
MCTAGRLGERHVRGTPPQQGRGRRAHSDDTPSADAHATSRAHITPAPYPFTDASRAHTHDAQPSNAHYPYCADVEHPVHDGQDVRV